MPPRLYEQLVKQEKAAAKQKERLKAPGASQHNPHILNDGSVIADGVRIKRKAWADCKDCGRRIYFVKVGDNCTCHPLPIADEASGLSSVGSTI